MDDLQQDDDDGLFERITPGFHEGVVISDLGWAAIHLRAAFGIENFIGIARFGTQSQFFDWMEKTTEADLSDWEAVTLKLYECWKTARTDFLLPGESPFSFSVWSHRRDPDAVTSRLVEVFALRHRAWSLMKEGRERAFYCAVERSWAVAEWSRENSGQVATPQVMEGRQARGFSLSGKPKGADTEVVLTWPSSDLWALVEKAQEFSKNGVTEIHVGEGVVALRFEELDANTWRRMDKIDRQHGQNSYLLDLAREVGIT
jgi:hypothetical protein